VVSGDGNVKSNENNKKIKPERLKLIEMRKQANAIQAQIESTTEDTPSINSIRLNMHCESAKTNIFKRLTDGERRGNESSQNQHPMEFGKSPERH
jgi:hypothetical protein